MRLFDRRVLLAAAAALTLVACNKSGTAASGLATADDMSLGNKDAKVTVIEYASASCVHCAAFNNDVFPAFKAKYIDTGKVNYVMREFLTPPAEFAAAGFLTARCAGPDKYFTLLDAVYKNQRQMFESGDIRGGLLAIAQSAGLTEAQWNACVTDEAALKALNDRVEKYAKTSGVTGTPAFFVNGKKIAEGEVSLEKLSAAVDEAAK